jgi:gliding motility associated protien GldN
MNTRWFKAGLFAVSAVLLVVGEVNAQKPKATGTRTSRSRPASGYSSGYGNSGYTTGNAAASANQGRDTTKRKNAATTNNSGYNSGYSSGYGQKNNAAASNTPKPTGNVPIESVKSNGGGIGDSVRPSLRTDNAIDRQLVKDRVPLAYDNIREDDAVYKQRVWREIDTREKMNLPFRYSAKEDNGDQRFISILYEAIQSGDITAFSGDDDRFTTPLTKEQVAQVVMGGNDTVPVTNLEGEVVKYEVRQKMIEPDSIYRFRIKEEWIFDKETSRMVVRILGIAPVMMKYTSTGIPVGDVTLFWAYYPDLRPTLAKYEVYNGKNYAGRMTWEELFESRFFSSRITKSTIDNPFDQSLAGFIKDPLFRLLEGENIKDKIFNYEQDLWSY